VEKEKEDNLEKIDNSINKIDVVNMDNIDKLLDLDD